MGLVVDSKVDDALKAKIIRVAKEQGLQYDDMFVNKTCSFQVLLDVRHSVMLLGPTGCGKTIFWKTLQAAYNLDKPKKVCVVETVNPKALTGDQLYGFKPLMLLPCLNQMAMNLIYMPVGRRGSVLRIRIHFT
jgi:dynein heavy chain